MDRFVSVTRPYEIWPFIESRRNARNRCLQASLTGQPAVGGCFEDGVEDDVGRRSNPHCPEGETGVYSPPSCDQRAPLSATASGSTAFPRPPMSSCHYYYPEQVPRPVHGVTRGPADSIVGATSVFRKMSKIPLYPGLAGCGGLFDALQCRESLLQQRPASGRVSSFRQEAPESTGLQRVFERRIRVDSTDLFESVLKGIRGLVGIVQVLVDTSKAHSRAGRE